VLWNSLTLKDPMILTDRQTTPFAAIVMLTLAIVSFPWHACLASDSHSPAVTQHDILPILLLRCTVCHGPRKQEGGLDLSSREAILRGGKSGPAMVVGKPDESLMLRRILDEEMPPRRRLVEARVKPMEPGEVDLLRQWIEMGAPQVPDPPAPPGGSTDPLVSEEDRQFWAFQSPRKDIVVPSVRGAERVRNPIDAFVLGALENAGLEFAPEAERRVLIRRAHFDLTGLAPEPRDVEAFLADPRVDAYERLIDHLLESPRYGERWGRIWLDVAGYSDSEGKTDQDLARPHAWRYRDYVIRAHNSDKPYDRFLLEQIAGDELSDYESAEVITRELYDNLVATGFLRQGPDGTWADITGFVPDRLEVIADAIDVLGRGVLGLTLNCARCHDHKFDPIGQRDYFRLTAMFKGAYDEHDWLKPQTDRARHLPHVMPAERRAWEVERDSAVEESKQLEAELAALKKASTDDADRIQSLEKKVSEAKEKIPREPMIRALWDRGQPSPTYFLQRGNYKTPDGLVQPGFPSVLAMCVEPIEIRPPWPGSAKTGRRLALARWLIDPDHPLTARVAVNRIWKHHFRDGLVKSLGNFGRTGTARTHPELLDWLAVTFVRDGWSMKSLHRLIMTSATYRQVSVVSPVAQQRDPDNRLLSRFPLKRLDAETVRDTLLHVSGRLDETRYGPPVGVDTRADGLAISRGDGDHWRRSIYIEQRRKTLPTILEVFDLPQMNPNCLERPSSTVVTQALHLLNDGRVWQLARYFAQRIYREAGPDPLRQIDQAFLRALGRLPTDEERTVLEETFSRLQSTWKEHRKDQSNGSAEMLALENMCHILFNSAEFIYVD